MAKKSKTIIVFPQNINYKYCWIDYKQIFNESIKIKDMLLNFIDIISKNLFNINGFEIFYSKNKTTINEFTYKSDFNFIANIEESFNVISKSDNSDKITTIIYDSKIITSLDIFESTKHLENYLLSIMIDENKKTDIPEWVKDINFFDDKKLKNDKLKNTEKINVLNEKNKKINDKLEINNKFKRILYTSGDELEEIVIQILDDMLKNNSSNFINEKKEDFLIKKESVTFIGEIKGLSSAVGNKNVSQLDVHVQGYMDKIESENSTENVKGLLIINYQRNKKISERNEIHKNQIDLAIRNGALIIDSVVLLKLYEKFLEKKLDTQKIIKLFTKKVGILQEKDIK